MDIAISFFLLMKKYPAFKFDIASVLDTGIGLKNLVLFNSDLTRMQKI